VFLLVPVYPSSPGPEAVKRLCVCVDNVFGAVMITKVITRVYPVH